jgi:glucosylceramidase
VEQRMTVRNRDVYHAGALHSLAALSLGVGFLLWAWPLPAADVTTLTTRLDDGDRKDARLRETSSAEKYGVHQDEGYDLLRSGSTPILDHSPHAPLRITVDAATGYQTVLGHGAAMTDASAFVLMNLKSRNPQLFDYVMKKLFSPSEGAGFSVLRLPMGSSDYTATPRYYTYCDEPSADLSKFSIDHDRQYIIPALQEALRLNADIRIIGSPWSAPAWMKTNGALTGITEPQKTQGMTCRLKPEYYDLYAAYFVKFIESYQAAGIEVYGVTLQNEPQYDAASYPCMRMDAEDQIQLIRCLGPRLAAQGLQTRIFVHDHNWVLHPNDRRIIGGDAKRDPLESVTRILTDSESARYVAGTAWHCYSGDAEAMRRTYGVLQTSFPDKLILCTEASGWGRQRGPWYGDVEWGMSHNWMGGLQHGCQASLQWNLVLDHQFGPTLRADSEATGMAAIDTARYDEARFEREYYAMAQMSRAARPGSRRIATLARGEDVSGLETIAFALPDGRFSLVVFNKQNRDRAAEVEAAGKFFTQRLPGRSIVTFLW